MTPMQHPAHFISSLWFSIFKFAIKFSKFPLRQGRPGKTQQSRQKKHFGYFGQEPNASESEPSEKT